MSGIFAEIKSRYPEPVEKLMKKFPECVIYEARDFSYPIFRQNVRYAVSVLKKCNIFEEFIMKAASLEISSEITTGTVGEMLGMDEIFLADVVQSLADKGVLIKDELPLLKLSAAGEKYLSLLSIPDHDEAEEIEYYIDKKFITVYCAPESAENCPVWDKYGALDKFVENAKKYISRKFLCEAGKITGKEIEDEKTSRRITSVLKVKNVELAHTRITEFVFAAKADEKKEIIIYDHAGRSFRDELSKFANKYVEIKGKI